MIDQLKVEYPVQVICDVIGYSRSRYYYQPRTAKESEEEALKKAINNVAGRYPTYGYRRIAYSHDFGRHSHSTSAAKSHSTSAG